MGLLEKSLRVASTYKANSPGLLRALHRLHEQGEDELLNEVRIVVPPHIRREIKRRGLM